MEISLEETGALTRRMVVNVPEDKVEREVETRLKSLAKTARIDGFRPGKVPINVIKDRFGGKVREEVVSEVIRSSFQEAIESRSLKLAGAPEFPEQNASPGEGVTYTATFEVFPEISLNIPADMKINKPVVEINDSDVDAMIDTLLKQRASWDEVSRAAADGDRLTVDWSGSSDGEVFDEGKGTAIVLGKESLGFDGVDSGLIGVSAGEERRVDVAIPAEDSHGALAGKTVKIEVKVTRVEVIVIPEPGDELFKSFGVTDGGFDAFREEVRRNMERERDQAIKSKVKTQVFDTLYQAMNVEIPETMINAELSSHDVGGIPIDDKMRDDARKRLAMGMIANEIVAQQGIQVEPERVRTLVDAIASSYEEPEQVVQWYYADRQRMADIESVVLEDAVADWVITQCESVEQPVTFNELMQRS